MEMDEERIDIKNEERIDITNEMRIRYNK